MAVRRLSGPRDALSVPTEDLERWLRGEPIAARPVGWLERIRRWYRRNPVVAGLITVVAALIVAGLVGREVSYRAIARGHDEALRQRRQADERFRLAFRIVEELRAYIGSYEDPPTRDFDEVERDAWVKRTLDEELIRYYQALVESQGADAAATAELAGSYYQLGALLVPDRQRNREAQAALSRSIELYRRLATERDGDSRTMGSLAMATVRLGDARVIGDDPVGAERAYEEALVLFEAVARRHPSRVDDWGEFLLLTDRYETFLQSSHRGREAAQLDRRILAHFERPDFLASWIDAARDRPRILIRLSRSLLRSRQFRAAIEVLRRAEPLLRSNLDLRDYELAAIDAVNFLAVRPDRCDRELGLEQARHSVHFLPRSSGCWEVLSRAHFSLEQRAEANETAWRAFHLSDRDPETMNVVAWNMITTPEYVGFYDPDLAVSLARKAIERQPTNALYWNTLGVALYRKNDWAQAITSLENSRALVPSGGRPGSLPSNGLFLAVAHQRLGHTETARRWYDQAVIEIDPARSNDKELRRYRTETATLLGLTAPEMPNGMDAFEGIERPSGKGAPGP